MCQPSGNQMIVDEMVAVRALCLCGFVSLWLCVFVALCLCVFVALWLCGFTCRIMTPDGS